MHEWGKEWKVLNPVPEGKQSPEMNKKKAKVIKSPAQPPPDIDLPQSRVKPSMGVTPAVFRFLEACISHTVIFFANMLHSLSRSSGRWVLFSHTRMQTLRSLLTTRYINLLKMLASKMAKIRPVRIPNLGQGLLGCLILEPPLALHISSFLMDHHIWAVQPKPQVCNYSKVSMGRHLVDQARIPVRMHQTKGGDQVP